MNSDLDGPNAGPQRPGWKIVGGQVQRRQPGVGADGAPCDLILYVIFKKGMWGVTKAPTLLIVPGLPEAYDKAWLRCVFSGHPTLAALTFPARAVVARQGTALSEVGAQDAELIHTYLSTGRDFEIEVRRDDAVLFRATVAADDSYPRLAIQLLLDLRA